MNKHKGFTLLELLIVIGILAVLAAITVVVLNPTELLRRARDSRRVADINAIRSGLSFYMTEIPNPDMDGETGASCSNNIWWTAGTANASSPFTTGNVTSSGAINGNGWIPVNLATTVTGWSSPLSNYPIDPINGGSGASPSTRYGYVCEMPTPQFTLFANMESVQYKTGGTSDVESKDGGVSGTVYEVGTKLGIASSTHLSTFYPSH